MAIIQPSQLATGSYSLSGSFSGSFQGNGAGLNNIPASAIVGLSSTQIASGNVTASVSTGTGSFTVTSGSSTFMFVSSSGNVGFGTTTPVYKLDIINSTAGFISINRTAGASAAFSITNIRTGGGQGLVIDSTGGFSIRNGSSKPFIIDGLRVGIGTDDSALTSRLQIKGEGSTSATTALLVQNANASASLTVLDNGSSTILSSAETGLTIQHTNGNYTSIINGNGSAIAAGQMGMYFNGTKIWTWNGAIFQIPGSVLGTGVNATTLQILGGWGGATIGTSLRLGSNTGNQGVFTATTGTQSTVEIGNAGNETWSPSSGNATYNLLNLVPRFNTTGTYSGISRGLYYAPTLTSITGLTHRAIETVTGDVILGSTSGRVAIGTTADTGHKLTVSGSGASGSVNLDNTLYVSGSRVGIGTSTPSTALHVRASNSSTGIISVVHANDASNFGARIQLYDAQSGEPTVDGANGLALIYTNNTGTSYLWNYNNGPLLLGVNNGEALRIASTTRNVLINTTTDAGFKLDVNGTARVKDAGSELTITSPLSAIAPVIFTTKGASGGYRGGYNFKGGYGGTAGNTILIIDTGNTDATSRGGFGNFVFNDLASAKFTIDNTQSGGRNAGLRLRGNFANTSTEYNGIDFNAYTGTDIGGFIGSQRNTATSGFGADIVVLATLDSGPSTYLEVARFIGRYNSFYVGTDKTLAVASAKMQIESTTQGFLPPRMTGAQAELISSPAEGLMVYATNGTGVTITSKGWWGYDGATWVKFN
jgi:hypothetical protein